MSEHDITHVHELPYVDRAPSGTPIVRAEIVRHVVERDTGTFASDVRGYTVVQVYPTMFNSSGGVLSRGDEIRLPGLFGRVGQWVDLLVSASVDAARPK